MSKQFLAPHGLSRPFRDQPEPSYRPFAGTKETKLAAVVRKLTKKLSAAYSAHHLRHLYAVTEYRKDRDLHRLSKLLGHASVNVTERYLRGLGEAD